jgi:CO/xanthine dehydrogenase Mo-binding subunit
MNDDTRIGAARKRKEDPRFLTGASRFTDDIALAGQLHGVVVRSPHAHARIRAVDVTAARSMPGVRMVLTAADVEGEIPRPIPSYRFGLPDEAYVPSRLVQLEPGPVKELHVDR